MYHGSTALTCYAAFTWHVQKIVTKVRNCVRVWEFVGQPHPGLLQHAVLVKTVSYLGRSTRRIPYSGPAALYGIP